MLDHTSSDVPAAGECGGCHGGRRSFALGVSAVQLAHDAPAGELDLEDLVATERLTARLRSSGDMAKRIPRFRLAAAHGPCRIIT